MQNETGEFVDMYIPRKCSASNRIIAAKDHASIQINIADVDPTTGRMTGSNTTYAICGNIRRMVCVFNSCWKIFIYLKYILDKIYL
uniref:Small ribosomal subunit protein eS21 n=1 Tax=Magallana gigas TaxID=29159 RepID=A0A8W8JIR9_MAGGI